MTKKHFIKIAAALNNLRIKALNDGRHIGFDEVVVCLADICESYNENFDRDRFFKAVWGKE